MPIGSRNQAGFTYIGLLMVVVFFGLASVGAARLLAATERAEREAELLFIGHQYRQAIRSYLQAGQRAGQYPTTLEDLLLDRRYPTVRRHLRKVFIDPITGNADWGLVPAPEGGIMGVHSLSEREPLKLANFETEDGDMAAMIQARQAQGAVEAFGRAPYSYRDWRFVYRPDFPGSPRTQLR